MTSVRSGETGGQGIVASIVEKAGLGARLGVCEAARESWPEAPRGEEAALVVGVHPEARAAFAGGRACARAALAALGGPDAPLLRRGGQDTASRAPAWPSGFTGSISHARSHCAAIAAARRDFEAVGLDLEAPSRVTSKVLDRVCTARERARLETALETDVAGGTPALHFAAKEAFYKVWSPLTRRPIGFRDVEVQWIGEQRFEVELVGEVDPGPLGPGPWSGAFAVRGDLVAAIVFVPAR